MIHYGPSCCHKEGPREVFTAFLGVFHQKRLLNLDLLRATQKHPFGFFQGAFSVTSLKVRSVCTKSLITHSVEYAAILNQNSSYVCLASRGLYLGCNARMLCRSKGPSLYYVSKGTGWMSGWGQKNGIFC